MTSSSPADASLPMFEQALGCYPEGARQEEVIEDCVTMSAQIQGQSAGWTYLGGPQLLLDRRGEPLSPARRAVGAWPP